MGSVCDEHHHQGYKHHPMISPKHTLQDLNIPPRKLLSRRSDASSSSDYFSPSSEAAAAMMHKFLPCNGDSSSGDGGSDPDDDPYSSDEFRMYEFKVRKCTRSRSHDWTDCPFSHPGEKARRRDPRRFHYSGTVCPEYRRSGSCSRGDECDFAHGVFECWLHPARYRTEACKDGKGCKRKVCFFAHSPRELRVLPAEEEGDERDSSCNSQRGGHNGKHDHHHQQQQQHCCRYCCALSPTSTLLGLSNFSPPLSPMKARALSRFSWYSDRASACGSKGLSYEDMVIAELLGSLEGMSLKEACAMSPNKSSSHALGRGLWVDVGGIDSGSGISCDDYQYLQQHTPQHTPQQQQQQQMQFSLSPTTPPVNNHAVFEVNTDSSPDLGWVNDLLM